MCSSDLSRWGLALFFLVFFLVGAGTFYSFGIKPLAKTWTARQWVATPAVVVSSEVRTHSGDDGPTYSVNILYRYEVAGREYRSNRRAFISGSSSGYAGKARVVSQFPPGKQITCYVNPHDPVEAVLERGFTPGMALGIIPLVFLGVGAGGLTWVFRTNAFQKTDPALPVWRQGPEWQDDRIRSTSQTSTGMIWAFALVWNAKIGRAHV